MNGSQSFLRREHLVAWLFSFKSPVSFTLVYAWNHSNQHMVFNTKQLETSCHDQNYHL